MEAAKLYPVQRQVQYRLQDKAEFPELDEPENQEQDLIVNTENPQNQTFKNKPPNVINQKQVINKNTPPNNTQTNNNNNNAPSEYITKTELEQIVNKLKVEIIKQLNVTKLINKIKQIQETIVNNISQANETNSKTNNHQLLIDINKQLNELVNPEILQNSEPPDRKS